jgi:penicillin G amidase
MKWLARIALGVAVLLATLLAGGYLLLSASLPRVDGTIAAGSRGEEGALAAPITIERDALGIPTVSGASREDVAFGTGFVHAQDRFFQMDLSRRLAAGELTALFGEVAAEQDADARAFRFREVAREVLRQASSGDRAILAAYARGVNAGRASLASRPWEYWVLGGSPQPWREEDSILVVYSMWWDLQYADWRREIVLRTLDARLGGAVCTSGWKCATEFFYPPRNLWDAPNAADALAPQPAKLAPLPPPEALDLRNTVIQPEALRQAARAVEREATPGSNNWAVAGRLTASGAALVANDMHLNARVPSVWYRARLVVSGEAQGRLDLNGVTLPGAPTLVAGSNGRIAWGFTNSYGDWQDVVLADCDTAQSGVRVAQAAKGRCWFVHWLAQAPAATNLRIIDLERAASVDEALALAPAIGIPHQNLVVGDREGHIGWTIIGRFPRQTGEARTRARGGWLDAGEQPRIVDPEIGRLWTANALATIDPAAQVAIADDEAPVGAGYDLGARARQIRDDLLAIERATPADMLRVQLDDRALFVARWRALLLDLLDEEALGGDDERGEFRKLVDGWVPRASADSVGYRLVRAYHAQVERAVWAMLLTGLNIPAEEARIPARFEAPLWRLVTEQPAHLLARPHTSWRAFLLDELDATLGELREECESLANCRWGDARPVRVRHPLSRALPVLARFLDMPTVELPGDTDMPRVQIGSFGASERFAVSPGHESDGYLHIAGGQSGHPLSPFYRAGFTEWAEGRALSFLPGPAKHRLVLR